MIYENGILKRILVDGGYIEGGVYYFYLADHERNNRVVANAGGTVVQTNHYYPFGMPFTEGNATSSQPYKYNGKELDTERGLNLYDYGARLYDPVLARWTTQDLMAEKYYNVSPYAYCGDNPD
jgi:RHS repeat-associated protein